MATMRENFLRLMKNDEPMWLGDPWRCFNENPVFRPVIFDAVAGLVGAPMPGQLGYKNAWGVEMDWPEGQPGGTPNITDENKVIKDITHWRDYVKFPSLDNLDWAPFEQQAGALDRENLLVMTPSFMGMFEFSHNLMGFMDALTNYLIEPEDMYDLLSAYTDSRSRPWDRPSTTCSRMCCTPTTTGATREACSSRRRSGAR